MPVSRDDVKQIAGLARLNPPDHRLDRLTAELNGILAHVRHLEEVDVSRVDEAARVTGSLLPLRPEDLKRDPLVDGAPGRTAPDWQDGLFVVPRLPALDGGDAGGRER